MSAKSSHAPTPRLGRGLSSLIKMPDAPVERDISTPSADLPKQAVATIPIKDIRPNPHQPRRAFNESTLAELAASIKTAGLIQPIVVRKATEGYELIAGERRWRAALIAGLSEIPAIIRQADASLQAQMALIENIQREDLNPLDRADAYQSLIDQLGLTQNELAARLGEERSSIANFLRLLSLSEPVRLLLRDGRLSLGHAKLLAGVTDPGEQKRLAELAVNRDLSVRNLEQLLRNNLVPPPPMRSESASSTAHVSELEQTISRQLGLRVQLRTGSQGGKGKLIIHYGNLDQFDELLKRVQVTIPTE